MPSEPTVAEVRELQSYIESSELPDHRIEQVAALCRLALAVLEPGDGVDVAEGLRLEQKIRDTADDIDACIAASIEANQWRRDNHEKALKELARLLAERKSDGK